MSKMNHAEVAEQLERLSNDFEEVGTPGNAKILRSAAADECRIANGELVEVVHARWVMRPFDVTNDKYGMNKYNTRIECTNCGFVTSSELRYTFCPSCGALMDEAHKGDSLNGKDDNHATD